MCGGLLSLTEDACPLPAYRVPLSNHFKRPLLHLLSLHRPGRACTHLAPFHGCMVPTAARQEHAVLCIHMQAIAAARILVDELDLQGMITPEQVSAFGEKSL